MSRRKRANARRSPARRLLETTVAFLGFCVFTLAAWGVHDTNERLEHPTAKTTPATIDEVHYCIGKCDDYLVVSFETGDGRTVTTELHDAYWQPHPQVGDEIVVRYDPTDPETHLRDERLGSDRFSFWLLTTFAAGMAGMTVLSLRIRPLFR